MKSRRCAAVVEHHPGHDTMFYNVMRSAVSQGHYLEDVFGDQNGYYKHALVKASRFCDGIFAVGDYVLKEIRFLGPDFVHVDSQLAYNGVPCWKISVAGDRWPAARSCAPIARRCWGTSRTMSFRTSPGWCPAKACGATCACWNTSSAFCARATSRPCCSRSARKSPRGAATTFAGWSSITIGPSCIARGCPTCPTARRLYYQGVQEFNARSRNVKVVFVNQFGFEQKICGARMPADMEFMDIRKGSDVEFGQSIYEPFGIAQVEPISFGGICVFSSVCGCAGFVDKAAGGQPTPNVIVADYTDLPTKDLRPDQLLAIGQPQRDEIEHAVAGVVAKDLVDRLPRSPKEFEQFIDRGHALASKMSWDVVARDYVLPGIQRASRAQRLKQIA